MKYRTLAFTWSLIATAIYRLSGGVFRQREPFWGWYLVATGEAMAWGELQIMPREYAMRPRWFGRLA